MRPVTTQACVELAYAHQIDGTDDRTNGDLHDGARHDRHEEADKQELPQHLHQLPPEALRVVLAVEEADGARERRLLARKDGGRRLEEEQGAKEPDADRVDCCKPRCERRREQTPSSVHKLPALSPVAYR